MITSIFTQLDFLIKPFQAENQRLYQALSLIGKAVDAGNVATDLNKQIDFGVSLLFQLGGVRADATDTYPTRPRLYLPRNPGNNLVAQDLINFQPRLKLQYVGVTAKIPLAGGGPYIVDLLISRDNGVNFIPLFKTSTNPTQLIVGQVFGSNKIFSFETLLDGDLFRVDETGTDGTLEGIEIYLLGNLVMS